MKKLLILMLVLGLTSAASATVTLSISVDVDKDGPIDPVLNPAETDIYLTPSQEIWIDIQGTVPMGEYTAVYLVAQGPGEMSGGTMRQGTGGLTDYDPADELDTGYTWQDFMTEYFSLDGVSNAIAFVELVDSSTTPGALSGVMMDERLFHCTGPDDVKLTLVDGDANFGHVYAEAYIHQPEPMTIALLGLGGLFLRRRR